MIALDLHGGADAAKRFVEALDLFSIAASLGWNGVAGAPAAVPAAA